MSKANCSKKNAKQTASGNVEFSCELSSANKDQGRLDKGCSSCKR